MKVVCLKSENPLWESQILGTVGKHYYAPKHGWGNANVGVHLYKDVKLTIPVTTTILKERLTVVYETTDEHDEGIEVLESKGTPKEILEAADTVLSIKPEVIRGSLPLTFRVREALRVASPSILLMVTPSRVQEYLKDIVAELNFLNAPIKVNMQRGIIRVGLSTIRVAPLGDSQETKQNHAGCEYSTIIIDEPFVMSHPDFPMEGVGAFMQSRIRVSK